MAKYRVTDMGYRRMESGMMRGLVVRRGSVIDELDSETGRWIYHACMHPDDAEPYTRMLNARAIFAEADFRLSNDGHASLDSRGAGRNMATDS